MIEELKLAALVEDIPEHNLKKGDVGTIVFVHQDGKAFEVEFMTFGGDTVAVLTLEYHQIRELGNREIAQAREVTL